MSLLERWRHTIGQRRTRASLRSIADRLLRDVLLSDGLGGHIGVDALLLRDGRLYILVIRHADGAIFAGEKMDHWAVIGQYERLRFDNPLHRLHDQLAVLRMLVPELLLEPRIVFTGHGHFPKGRPPGVELLEEFVRPLRRSHKAVAVSLDTKVETAWNRLCDAARIFSSEETPRRAPTK